MSRATIAQNPQLIKSFFDLLEVYRYQFGQDRTYQRIVALVLSEFLVFGRHTVTQLLMALGLNESDWSGWYRLFSEARFDAEAASAIMFAETLRHVPADACYVVVGDSTQTPRTGRKIEGTGWLRNPRNPPFMVGIHHAQRWFNGCWLMPLEQGYSRALPLRWMPAFTEKSRRQVVEARKEWQCAIDYLHWLRQQLSQHGREQQPILLVVDGSYDTVNLWQHLPHGATVLARTAKNRVLHQLCPPHAHGNRKYGARAPRPQDIWQQRHGWRKTRLTIRGRKRKLQYRVAGPFLRKGAPDTPLFLVVVRGEQYRKHGQRKHREPVGYLVNAVRNAAGVWVLPLPIASLLVWAWQRWEIEVCHRELKSNFGLGDKQCWNAQAAVASVQWSAWCYGLGILAGYRTWGLCGGPEVPTRWWRGSGRWSLNTLWRSLRASLWQAHDFRPCYWGTPNNWLEKAALLQAQRNAIYAASAL